MKTKTFANVQNIVVFVLVLALRLYNFSTYARLLLKLTAEISDQKAPEEMILT